MDKSAHAFHHATRTTIRTRSSPFVAANVFIREPIIIIIIIIVIISVIVWEKKGDRKYIGRNITTIGQFRFSSLSLSFFVGERKKGVEGRGDKG